MKYNAHEVPKWKLPHRSWNAQLIPKKLQELALQGKFYGDKII